MEELLERLWEECRPYTGIGKTADYIPELAKRDPKDLGVYVIGSEGKHSWAGDCRQAFTLQSVVKPILLLQALLDNGAQAVQARVGVEATGKPFDAINGGEHALDSRHINPMVNMGAIVMCTMIHGGHLRGAVPAAAGAYRPADRGPGGGGGPGGLSLGEKPWQQKPGPGLFA